MVDGRYVYCITDNDGHENLGKIGLYDSLAYTASYKDISAVLSTIPFKEIQPNVNEIASHQRVVEAARSKWTTLPVRFGTIFKTEDGVKKLLTKSYKDFKSKIVKFENKDEFGVKVILDHSKIKKIRRLVENSSEEIKKIKDELVSAGHGTSYFLKMRMDEAVKNETLRKIDQISGEIHGQLAKKAVDSRLLKSDLDQIILNVAYLIDRKQHDGFNSMLEKLREKYESEGMALHVSGPWAPYSFC